MSGRTPSPWPRTAKPMLRYPQSGFVRAARGRNLFFSTDVDDGIRRSDIIFLSVNTPTKSYGIGAGSAADIEVVAHDGQGLHDGEAAGHDVER